MFEETSRLFLVRGQRSPTFGAGVFDFRGIGIPPLIVLAVEEVGVVFGRMGVQVIKLLPAVGALEHACKVAPPYITCQGLKDDFCYCRPFTLTIRTGVEA